MKILMLLFFILGLLTSQNLFAQFAKRKVGETYSEAKFRSFGKNYKKKNLKTSAENTKVELANIDFKSVPNYETLENINKLYLKLRDMKPMKDPEFEKKSRRLSWMYPDDGCFARAALMVKSFEKWKLPLPKKLFIFGNLKVQTDFNPRGEVRWWYHVVPTVRAGKDVYVIDPSIENTRPLTIKEWTLRQVPEIKNARFSLCHSLAYSPSSKCLTKPSTNPNDRAIKDQITYLKLERKRLKSLDFNVDDLLGEQPPWK